MCKKILIKPTPKHITRIPGKAAAGKNRNIANTPTTSKKLYIALLIVLLSVVVYLKPELFLSGKMLYKIGANRLKAVAGGDYHDNDKVKSAIYYFEKAVKKSFVERDVFDKLSYCYLISNNNIKAERILTTALRYYPNDAEFYFDRGNCRKELQNFNGALLDFDKVISVDTAFQYLNEAIYYRGAMTYILGDTVKANRDKAEAQKITGHLLTPYAEYCQNWK